MYERIWCNEQANELLASGICVNVHSVSLWESISEIVADESRNPSDLERFAPGTSLNHFVEYSRSYFIVRV